MNKKMGFIDKREKNEKLLSTLRSYYQLKDLENNYANYYLGIFNALYIDVIKLNYDEIASKFLIDVRTLHTYRKSFNSFAEKLLASAESGETYPIEN